MICAGCMRRREKVMFWFRNKLGAASRYQTEKYLKILDLHQHSEFEKVGNELVNLRDRVGALEVAATRKTNWAESVTKFKIDTLKDG